MDEYRAAVSRDIAHELRNYLEAAKVAGDMSMPAREGCSVIPASVMMRAIAEIERLRGLAGAVSPGPSFTDIRAMAHDSVGRPHPVLKAFDGA